MYSREVNMYEHVLQDRFRITHGFQENDELYFDLLRTKEGCADLARWMNNELNNCIEQEQKERQ